VKGLAEIKIQPFDCDVEECIKRDLARPRSVGEKVIRDMYDKYLKLPQEVYRPIPGLPSAIICDIDGTLAKMVSRGPHDYDKVGEDEVHQEIVDIVRRWYSITGNHVIITSGRPESCMGLTSDWLTANGIPFDRLFMRPNGNVENDAIVKRRIFEENIRLYFKVIFVLDDRDRVVNMWRSLGLRCLQVAEGRF
jgi:hypothetical protein